MRDQNYAADPERPRQYLDTHCRIYAAVERGDARAAEEAVRRHLADIWQHLADGIP